MSLTVQGLGVLLDEDLFMKVTVSSLCRSCFLFKRIRFIMCFEPFARRALASGQGQDYHQTASHGTSCDSCCNTSVHLIAVATSFWPAYWMILALTTLQGDLLVLRFHTLMQAHDSFSWIGPYFRSTLPLNLRTMSSPTSEETLSGHPRRCTVLDLLGCHVKHCCEIHKGIWQISR